MSKKNNPKIIPPKKATEVKLEQAEATAIASIEARLVELKCRLANLVIQQQIVSQDVVLAEKEMIEKINEAATAHGIPPEDAGRWNFDTKSMTFTLRR